MVEDWAESCGFERLVVLACDDKAAAELLFEMLDGRELELVELLAGLKVEWPLCLYELLPLLFHDGLLVWDLMVVKPFSDGFETCVGVRGL